MKKLLVSELKRISVDEFKGIKKIPVIIVLDNIRSQHNIGAVLRTSDAYIIQSVFLCGITAAPPNNEIHKSALGAEFSVDWRQFDDTKVAIALLKELGYTILAIEQTDDSYEICNFVFDKNKQYALVFGNEVKGIDDLVLELCHYAIELPQHGTKHSLNVSVAAGIVIWEVFKALK